MKKRILLKIGGLAFDGDAAFAELAQDIKNLSADVVLVHGGGAKISAALKAAGRGTTFIDGVRVTEQEDIDIVENVLSGEMNAMIADNLQQNGVSVQRMSGKTDGLMIAEKTLRNGLDIGFVGRIVDVQPQAVLTAFAKNAVPVVSPVSANRNGQTFNINADTAAAALAVGIAATDLVYFSDVPGVLLHEKVIPTLTVDEGEALIADGTISGGMVAKMEAIFNAIHAGVQQVHISQWQGKNTLAKLLQQQDVQQTIISK